MRTLARFSIPLISLSLLLIAGCADQQKQQLDSGYAALDAHEYDQAISTADAYLQSNPQGRGAAEAWYLRGRAVEERGPKVNQTDADRDLQEARTDYLRALDLNPNPALEARIRASIGNVAYFQNDFATAAEQYGAAYDHLEKEDDKAWVLYRSGLSLQRLGRFEDADRTFATVEQQFPGSEQAARAREHAGKRAFYVQLASFSNPQQADAAVVALKKDGILAERTADFFGRGVFILQAGPYQRYTDAHAVLVRFSGEYPGAFVTP